MAIFKRYLYHIIDWNDRLIGIKGSRGTGKTTLLKQRQNELGLNAAEAVYCSLGDLRFTAHTVLEIVAGFHKKGARYLFLDRVHKYPGWAGQVKTLHEHYPDLHIVFAGSSIIDTTELDGIATIHELRGLSYREYLNNLGVLEIEPFRLEEILENTWKKKFPPGFRPLQYFDQYLYGGYYPAYHSQQQIRLTVECDMAELPDFDIRNSKKMLHLLYLVSIYAPFKPNISKLAEESQVHRNTINAYLQFLERAGLISLLYSDDTSQKPGKIFMENTNLVHTLAQQPPSAKNLCETFFVNQLSAAHTIRYPGKGDFIADEKYVFEISDRERKKMRVSGTLNSYQVLENEDFPKSDAIPLWLFGFLY